MARFVLVHGAFSGAWIWQPLKELLEQAGHEVAAFDLPGVGEDRTLADEVTLDACAARVCDALDASSEPAILVGHSMGGIVITQAAAEDTGQVAALVYVAAFMPRDGESLLELTKLPEGAGDQVQANLVVTENPPVATMPDAPSKDVLYASCSDEVATWAIGRHRPQPLAPMGTPVSIPPGALDSVDKYYVLCARDRAIPPALQRRMATENACAGVFELDTDHTPHLSSCAALCGILMEIAAQTG